MNQIKQVLQHFSVTLAAMLCGVTVIYVPYGRTWALPTEPAVTALAAALFALASMVMYLGGWNLMRLADDWVEVMAPRFRSLAHIVAYMLMVAIVIGAGLLLWALLSRVLPGRAA